MISLVCSIHIVDAVAPVVLRTVLMTAASRSLSTVRGVYPVIRKWQRGVGMRDATKPTRSLFM